MPQRRHVERVARGEGEVRAEDLDVDRSGRGIVVALRCVDGACLHRAEQLAMRHQLVGGVELDLHLAVRRLVEPLDRVADHVLGERRSGIGLQPPLDRRLRLHVGRGERRRAPRPKRSPSPPSSGSRVCSSSCLRSSPLSLLRIRLQGHRASSPPARIELGQPQRDLRKDHEDARSSGPS